MMFATLDKLTETLEMLEKTDKVLLKKATAELKRPRSSLEPRKKGGNLIFKKRKSFFFIFMIR